MYRSYGLTPIFNIVVWTLTDCRGVIRQVIPGVFTTPDRAIEYVYYLDVAEIEHGWRQEIRPMIWLRMGQQYKGFYNSGERGWQDACDYEVNSAVLNRGYEGSPDEGINFALERKLPAMSSLYIIKDC